MKTDIIIEQYELGPMANFLYMIGDKEAKEVAIVDPAWDVDFLRNEAAKQGWKIVSIFLTHGHHDHVNGLNNLLATHDVPVYISEHEAAMFTPNCANLKKIKGGSVLKVGNVSFDVLHTPGHSPGCQCFLNGSTLIAGDTIFIDGCGRCDLPGSDPAQMYDSLYGVIAKLPDETVIYPGHNYGPKPTATVGEQKQTNPFLLAESKDDFLFHRMG